MDSSSCDSELADKVAADISQPVILKSVRKSLRVSRSIKSGEKIQDKIKTINDPQV